jgi:hypothetical protein
MVGDPFKVGRGGQRIGAGRKKLVSPVKRSARNNRDRDKWRKERFRLSILDQQIDGFPENERLKDEYKSLVTERSRLAARLVFLKGARLGVEEEARPGISDEPEVALSSDSDEVRLLLILEYIFENLYQKYDLSM